ncbi:MAG TPA: phage portal protein [Epulopiscium sp.]|nr:phage portal protein [Candidatus Epulonipiscium sp.]
MGITDWFRNMFNKNGKLSLNAIIGDVAGSTFYKELALQSSINLIANTIAKSEFVTYEKGKKVQKTNHYILNVEPNKNISSSIFWREVINKLIYESECLVIMQDGMLYVADSFNRKEFAFKENIYTDITVSNYALKDVLRESEVMYFKWYGEETKTVISGLNDDYSKLIELSSKSYKRNKGRKGTLEIPTSYPQTDEAQADLQELLDKRFKTYFEAEGDALLPLTDGLKYNERQETKSTKDNDSSREIRAFADDIFDFVAMAIRIPPQLLKGDIADTGNAVNDYLAFCINPLMKFITDEINRKMYKQVSYNERTYVRCDTTNVKVVDLKDIANALDVLTRIGAYSIDESLKALGMEPLNTSWSQARFMTKNYQPIEEMMKGGE